MIATRTPTENPSGSKTENENADPILFERGNPSFSLSQSAVHLTTLQKLHMLASCPLAIRSATKTPQEAQRLQTLLDQWQELGCPDPEDYH
jgi:hypothetical protein